MRRCAVSDVSRSEGSQRSMRTGVGEVPKSGNLPGKNMDGTSEEPVVLVPVEVLSRKFNKLIIANHNIGTAYTSNFHNPPFVFLFFLFLVHSLLFMATLFLLFSSTQMCVEGI